MAGGAHAAVVHGSAMLLLPATMGFSTVLCLAWSPSPFSLVAIDEYLRRTKYFERIWLLVACGWIGVAVGQGQAWMWTVATAALALTVLGVHVWQAGSLHRVLDTSVEATRRAGPVTMVNDDGMFVALRRTGEGAPAPVAGLTVGVHGCVLLASVGVFVGVALTADRSLFGVAVLVGGFWLSLGVIGIDLVQDVWPGTTSRVRLGQCFRYYVQIFEQWRNMAVLAGFAIVLIGAPIAWATGHAAAAVLAFPLWIGSCVVFALFVNQVLQRKSWGHGRLPLPMWVNEYSATRPFWAHFLAVIHTGMAVALLAGLVALNAALP